ncbi:hypothetical protein DRJ16_00135 [Candidatus Woesearchaeota archaeon]|nr:MAG: hypothetical protein DRJ16_00135 [Candidatus Woesearchaeota archaeon]
MKQEKIFAAFLTFYIFSIFFDFSLTYLKFKENPREILLFEKNAYMKTLLMGEREKIIPIVLAQVPPLGFLLSFYYLSKITNNSKVFKATILCCLVLAAPHIYGGLSWYLV